MKTEKLELKYVAPYLPYGLQVLLIDENEIGTVTELADSYLRLDPMESNFDFDEIKLVLRPLSDLIKEIEHNGEKFIPYETLDKLAFENLFTIYDKDWFLEVPFNFNDTEYWILQKLFEWGFDVFNLHENGLCMPLINKD